MLLKVSASASGRRVMRQERRPAQRVLELWSRWRGLAGLCRRWCPEVDWAGAPGKCWGLGWLEGGHTWPRLLSEWSRPVFCFGSNRCICWRSWNATRLMARGWLLLVGGIWRYLQNAPYTKYSDYTTHSAYPHSHLPMLHQPLPYTTYS